MLFLLLENDVGTSLYATAAAERFAVPLAEVTTEMMLRIRAEASSWFYGQHDSAWPVYLLPVRDALYRTTDHRPAVVSPRTIPTAPCFACGGITDETRSAYGVGHRGCFNARVASPAELEAFYAKYPDMDFRARDKAHQVSV